MQVLHFIKVYIYWPIVNTGEKTFLTWQFYAILVGIYLLEKFLPAQKGKKFLSVNSLQDMVWFFVESIGHAFITSVYVAFIFEYYHQHLSFLTLNVVFDLPSWLKILISILLLDFLYWLQHFLNHKVGFFWYFHVVHHSQKELNLFTDFRYHTFEYIVRHTVLTIPFLLLGLDFPTVFFFVIFQTWFTRFYHANLKTNLGLLRYVLVTPQSHRIHHSIEAKHQDKNFGSLFVFWDFIFNTQYLGFDEYPETGIKDQEFPHEHSRWPMDLLITPFKQMWYPFHKIINFFRKK